MGGESDETQAAPTASRQSAGVAPETESQHAWGLHEGYEEERRGPRFSPGVITIAVVVASLIVVVAAAVIVGYHLHGDASSASPPAAATAAPAEEPPKPAPAEPPSVAVQPPVLPPVRQIIPGNYTTYVSWTGTPCLEIRFPNGNQMMDHDSCSPSLVQDIRHTAGVNADHVIGADPVMGQALAIACKVVFDATGAVVASDSGTAGDGHDVNCIIKAPAS